MWQNEIPEGSRPIGYQWLLKNFQLKNLPSTSISFISPKWEKRSLHFKDLNLTVSLYPPSTSLPDLPFDHIEFALKHEGINLLILKNLLKTLPLSNIISYITSRPTGKYARIVWYLYEKFSKSFLEIPDLKNGTYTPILDPKYYYCSKGTRSSRHRILDNLLGTTDFSPLLRKTQLLQEYEKKEIEKKAFNIAQRYDLDLLTRAMQYLYTKETMSSWEIERERPNHEKLAKFVRLLHKADSIGSLDEKTLVDLQKSIVDPRFASLTYRDFQNYVGEEPNFNQIIIHFISPKPCDVKELMEQLLHSFSIMELSGINAVIAASILSFGFVFIHPFEDGNGRIHRFLIHYTLARFKYTPEGIVFPVSAAIARNTKQYDKVLETFSKPLIDLITQYTINDIGEMEVKQDTRDLYSYIDFTPFAEYLFECVDKTITIDFEKELNFLADYDRIKRLCKEVIDMPDQKIDLFIKCVRQNEGLLSKTKQQTHFPMLTALEIEQMEKIINSKLY